MPKKRGKKKKKKRIEFTWKKRQKVELWEYNNECKGARGGRCYFKCLTNEVEWVGMGRSHGVMV